MEEVVSESFKCVNCQQITSTPFVLPCRHVVCERHTETAHESIVCSACGATHLSNNEYMAIKTLEQMTKAKAALVDFSSCRQRTLELLDSLTTLFDQKERVVENLEVVIHEKIRELKNNVLLKREQVKLLVDQRCEEIVTNLEVFQEQCLQNLNQDEFKSSADKFKQDNRIDQQKYNEWKRELNEPEFGDKTRCKHIQTECERIRSHHGELLDNFFNQIFISKYENVSECFSNCFDNINAILNVSFDDVVVAGFSNSSNLV